MGSHRDTMQAWTLVLVSCTTLQFTVGDLVAFLLKFTMEDIPALSGSTQILLMERFHVRLLRQEQTGKEKCRRSLIPRRLLRDIRATSLKTDNSIHQNFTTQTLRTRRMTS